MNDKIDGSVTRDAIAVMKSTPVILALLIFNVVWMGIVGWQTHEHGTRFERILDKALHVCTAGDRAALQ